ncbi:hypothetical protein HNR06_004441 [Nocardiopsis arvandica]|uniref:Uncharacterized protein n=1 Tax=Nocardiopsis sinuspersici TaxID=501010 RepID=A0A7Y9XHK5_9ACTN|nr:hypothetical protein [Nocardiopsis sinuspersici]NYH54852.1 hypothetical protein [Nocardiopsis sinuspersici]
MIAVSTTWFVARMGSEQVPSPPNAEATTSVPSPDEEDFVPLAGQAMAHDRFPVNFPHSPEGASSMVIVYLQALSTNDVETLSLAFDAYSDTEDPDARVRELLFPARVHDIEAYLPPGGTFDPETFPSSSSYYYIAPLGVTWDEVDSDTVDVWVLANEEVSDGGSATFTRSYIHGMRLEWDPWVRSGDWVITDIEDPSRSMAFDLGEEYYSLDHELWTPIFFPEGDGGR